MSSMRQGGERIVNLHPIFTLKRVVSAQETGDILALCREIHSFAAQHGDQNLIARGEVSILEHLKWGELVLVYEGVKDARRLIGVCACVVSPHRRPSIELAYTAVHSEFRGRGLAHLAASAALVCFLMNNPVIEGIVLACRPSNQACLRAAEKMGVSFYQASDLYPRIPRLKTIFHFHRQYNRLHNSGEEPLFGLVKPQAVRDGAWRLLQADDKGLAWRRGGRVYLDGEWYLSERERESSRSLLLEMVDGRLPRVKWWDDPPPQPRIDRCA